MRVLKGVTCNNIGEPLGTIRRVVCWGYHNHDPAQMFRSSLPFGRVLEEPPGELPVVVAYRLNGCSAWS